MRAPAEQVTVDVDSSFEWPFEVKTIIVDNLTDHYAYSPDAQRWIQPNIAGLVLPIHPTQTPRLLWVAPPGKTQPVLGSAAQQATVVFTDQLFPPTSGSTVVQTVTTAWQDGTVALPGFANQNDLTLGFSRPAANQFSFSVGGVEQFRLTLTGAAIKDGSAANPGLSFMSDATSGIAKLAATTLSVSLNGIERTRFGALGGAGTVQTIISNSGTASAYTHYGDVAGTYGFVTGQAVTAAAHQYEIYDSTAGITLLQLGRASSDFLKFGVTPATAYTLRLQNNTYQSWRNAGNTTNIAFGVDNTDAWYWDNGAATVMSLTQATGQLNIANTVAIGTTTSTTGQLRLPTNGIIAFRNNGNTADVQSITLNTTDDLVLRAGTAANDTMYFQTNAANQLILDATGLNFAKDIWGPSGSSAAVDGFTFIPLTVAAPTGVPTGHTGQVPIVFNSGDNKLYVRSGGAWLKTAALV